MVAVFNKELLSWYLITLKLKEAVDSGKQQSPSSSSPAPVDTTAQDEPDSDWIISITEKLEQAALDEEGTSWAKLCIYRVPQSLRDEVIRGDNRSDKAFTPQLVSLGPYHYNQPGLKEMDRHKWRALRRALDRAGHEIRPYVDAARKLEDRARSCYEGPIHLSSNQWVECMVLDGFFVLEILQGVATTIGAADSHAGDGFAQLGYSPNDPVFAMRGPMHSIQRDMIMLENQIPLFVLDGLLGLLIGQPDQSGLVARLAVRFFDPLRPTDEPLRHRLESDKTRKPVLAVSSSSIFDPLTGLGGLHCLDVFRRNLLRRSPKMKPRRRSGAVRLADKRRQQLVYCMTELRKAGVVVRPRWTEWFWDICFEDGVLQIPRLLIHDGTKSLFLNLIAFEQCHLDCSNNITSYVIFMGNLINSSEDVEYLHDRGIIQHRLGSDAEVAELFNRLCQEVVFDVNDSYLSHLSEKVNPYYYHRRYSLLAFMKYHFFDHFKNPWALLPICLGLNIFLITFLKVMFN